MGNRPALAFLFLAALYFYASWRLDYLFLLLASIVFNYYLGVQLSRAQNKALLIFGVACDLGMLFVFKYAYWLRVPGIQTPFELPLGISFFTFQQISYRLECYQGARKQDDFLTYASAVTFFPHLIAGPIVLYSEIIPQLKRTTLTILNPNHMAAGLFWISIGIAKKVVLADHCAPIADVVFTPAFLTQLNSLEVWLGCLSYMMQIYFDFSGYCDIAIGLGLLFNIELPVNFMTPYAATSIIDFWRRWHVTLSRFMRMYVYIPLGGHTPSLSRHLFALVFTMTLGGIWHGAGSTFLLWGMLHGSFLAINHVKRRLLPQVKIPSVFDWILTQLCIFVGWVFFRAPDLNTSKLVIRGLMGQGVREGYKLQSEIIHSENLLVLSLTILICAWTHFKSKDRTEFKVNLDLKWAITCSLLLFFSLKIIARATPGPFLYFNF